MTILLTGCWPNKVLISYLRVPYGPRASLYTISRTSGQDELFSIHVPISVNILPLDHASKGWFTRTTQRRKHKRKRKKKEIFPSSCACACACVVPVHTYVFLRLRLCLRRPGSHVRFLALVLVLASSRFTRTFPCACACACVVPVHTYVFLRLPLYLRRCVARVNQPL